METRKVFGVSLFACMKAFPISSPFSSLRFTARENFFPDSPPFSVTLTSWRPPNRAHACQFRRFFPFLSQGANFSPISHHPRVLIMMVDSRVSFYFLFPRPAQITPQTRNRTLAKILELSAIVLHLYLFLSFFFQNRGT